MTFGFDWHHGVWVCGYSKLSFSNNEVIPAETYWSMSFGFFTIHLIKEVS